MKKMFNEGNQIHNFMSSSGSGTVINYGSGSDFLTIYGSRSGSGSTSQKVTVPAAKLFQQHSRHLKRNYELNSAFEKADRLLDQTVPAASFTKLRQ
jgi:hypothetical protein